MGNRITFATESKWVHGLVFGRVFGPILESFFEPMFRPIMSWLVLTTVVLSANVAHAKTCENAFAEASFSQAAAAAKPLTILDEQRALREAIATLHSKKKLPDGQSLITPVNREIRFNYNLGRTAFAARGRIVSLEYWSPTKEWMLVFAGELTDGFNPIRKVTSEKIPLGYIVLQTLRVKKVLSREEFDRVGALILDAVITNQSIRYLDLSYEGGEREGRITKVERDEDKNVVAFVLIEDKGPARTQLIESIDPDSITLFPTKHRKLSRSEEALFAKLWSLKALNSYVSFLATADGLSTSTEWSAGNGKPYRFEGWITAVDTLSNGEPRIFVSEQDPKDDATVRKFMLSEIIPNSVEVFTTLRTRMSLVTGQPEQTGRGAAIVTGTLQKGNKSIENFDVSQELYRELALFADSSKASGPLLPYEIESKVVPGSELRLYFMSGFSRIRLTIRRNAAGEWAFGNTAADGKIVKKITEAFRSSETRGRYTARELSALNISADELPFAPAELRRQMRTIRHALMLEQIRLQLKGVVRDWTESISESLGYPDMIGLLQYSQGVAFDLDRGFYQAQLAPLPPDQAKKLAAIQYLIAHKLAFYVVHEAEGLVPRLAPRDEEPPANKIEGAGDFEWQLYAELAKAGLVYVNGQWMKK